MEGDSLHQGRTYKKIYRELLTFYWPNTQNDPCLDTNYYAPHLSWLLRDSAEMIIGFRIVQNDPVERVYFDHRGQVGLPLPAAAFWNQVAIVDSVDSIRVLDQYRKRFHATSGSTNYTVTQGVGWLRNGGGTLLNAPGVIGYCWYTEPCFSIGDTTYYPEFRPGPCLAASLDQLWDPFSNIDPSPPDAHIPSSAYPNPTNGMVTILASEVGSTIELYTMRGDLVLTLAQTTASSLELDLSGYPEGTYILRIHRQNEVITERLVVIGSRR